MNWRPRFATFCVHEIDSDFMSSMTSLSKPSPGSLRNIRGCFVALRVSVSSLALHPPAQVGCGSSCMTTLAPFERKYPVADWYGPPSGVVASSPWFQLNSDTHCMSTPV